MLSSSLFAVLAAGAAMVAAETTDATTTSTYTMTQTYTITKCNPTHTDCPAYNSTTPAMYPMYNSTSSEGPTEYPYTPVAYPTSSYVEQTTYAAATPTQKSGPSQVSTSGAAPLFQSGLLLGLVAAGVALMA